ncbi:MAG: tripartite tricarboxylate transporter substrate binding protein [Burkholderiaceae bacterium]|nr:tripartite tricarboxylate transporter substrate binding protein [Burkholderiaceae bacterium]
MKHWMGILAMVAGTAWAQAPAWPSKPIQLIVPSATGSAPDILARSLGRALEKRLGQPLVVSNKPGAGGSLGADFVAKSAPDGYTLVMGNIGSHAMNVAVYSRLPYNPVQDFEAVALVAKTPSVMSVAVDFPVKNVAEFVTWARTRGENVTFASGGNGSSSHLAGEYLNLLAGLKMRHIPYKDVSQALLDVSTQQVSVMLSNLPPAMAMLRAGRNKALAVTSGVRASSIPQVPTLAESGYPAFVQDVWFGLFAPAGTPQEIVKRLNAEVTTVLRDPALVAQLRSVGAEPTTDTPEGFRGYVGSEIVRWIRVARQSGATAD